MDILIEIQKEEKEVQNLVKDWHVQKLESFIEDLIEKDRVEQLRLHNVVNRKELLLAFCEFMCSGTYDSDNTTHSQDVDAFLESQ